MSLLRRLKQHARSLISREHRFVFQRLIYHWDYFGPLFFSNCKLAEIALEEVSSGPDSKYRRIWIIDERTGAQKCPIAAQGDHDIRL